MKLTFGQPLAISFTPMAGADPVPAHSIIAARVYSSSPSDAQLADSTNALGGFVVGTTTTSNFEKSYRYEWIINLSSLTAPSIKVGGTERYYLAVNYRYVSGGAIQSQWEALSVFYPDGITARFGVMAHDIFDLESKLEDRSRAGENFVTRKIALAEKFLLAYLDNKGYARNVIRESDLKLVLMLWAAQLCCNDLSSESGDSWEVKALSYESLIKEQLTNIKLHFDDDGNNIITEELDKITARDSIVLR